LSPDESPLHLGLNQIEEEEKLIEKQPLRGKKEGNSRQNIKSNDVFTFVDKRVDASQDWVGQLSKENSVVGVL
jgi:hypothetical protein